MKWRDPPRRLTPRRAIGILMSCAALAIGVVAFLVMHSIYPDEFSGALVVGFMAWAGIVAAWEQHIKSL